MQEKRKSARKKPDCTLEVFDINTQQSLGYLVDISVVGLMLMRKQALEVNAIYQLGIKLPDEINGDNIIIAGVDILWCEYTEELQQHWVGCQIIDISTENEERIQHFISNLT